MNEETPHTEDYSEKVIPVLRRVRNILLPHWGNAEVTGQKDSLAVNVVTELDVKVENFVKSELAKLFPEIGFVGEEGGGDRSAAMFWLMDPIDGTGHFIRGLPFCTSMIALIENGHVNFSVIYDFVNDHAYWARRGRGAFRDSERLTVSSRLLAQSYIGWETNIDKKGNMENMLKLKRRTILFKAVSSGWEYAMIASGKLDGRICFDPYGKDYDLAPGSLLVSEAGGIVANLGSDTYDYRNTDFIAANPIIFKELTEGPEAIFPIPK